MSDPILPLQVWQSGTLQNSIPANDNALRLEALSRPCLGVANDESTPSDGDVYLVGPAPTGAYATFDENDIAIYRSGNWYAWAPVDGLRLVVGDARKIFVGGSTNEWQDDSSAGGSSSTVTVVTEVGAATMMPTTHAGLNKYVRAGGDVTFSSAEGYTEGEVYNIRATAAIDLVESGVTLTPESGGSLSLDSDMSVSIIMTSSTAGDVVGHTVAAS